MHKIKFYTMYFLGMLMCVLIALIVSKICFNLIDKLWFSVPMTFLALNIFGNPILDHIKQKYK